MSDRHHPDPVILLGKLDRLWNEITLIKKDTPYRKKMQEHFQAMCILTLLEYGSIPKLMFLLEQGKKELGSA